MRFAVSSRGKVMKRERGSYEERETLREREIGRGSYEERERERRTGQKAAENGSVSQYLRAPVTEGWDDLRRPFPLRYLESS